ncbi:MAG: hypothetical protein IPO78_02200 [Saprospiraceae bacterium]|nr:hypothetical protein [Saprospiraceae bacterium]MBK8485334.1 hypothetical protein [Saprospiraceae bacterium]MBK9222553.1 hypothetical protein [Saprospiraceae bacterium]MBK9720414.1 hypothetical protein [Saprospiraceae bacterium]MBK9727384.1 hypothetical protein [Saprospiraceae bacterium]
MNSSKFYLWLILTSILSLCISIFAVSGPNIYELNKASYILIAFFIFFTIVIFMFSNQAVKSSNPFLFTRVFIISISLKLLFLSMLVVLFVKFLVIKPRELVIPLLSSYLLFTILETWVLMKLAKTS